MREALRCVVQWSLSGLVLSGHCRASLKQNLDKDRGAFHRELGIMPNPLQEGTCRLLKSPLGAPGVRLAKECDVLCDAEFKNHPFPRETRGCYESLSAHFCKSHEVARSRKDWRNLAALLELVERSSTRCESVRQPATPSGTPRVRHLVRHVRSRSCL